MAFDQLIAGWWAGCMAGPVGFVGREEGISCYAVVLIARNTLRK